MFMMVPEVHTLGEGHVCTKPCDEHWKKARRWAGHLAEKRSRGLAAEKIRCDKLMP